MCWNLPWMRGICHQGACVIRPAIPNRPATRELTSDVSEWGVRMRGVPESSLDEWDLLSTGLSDVGYRSLGTGGRDAWR